MKRNRTGIDTDRKTEPDPDLFKVPDLDYNDLAGHMRGDEDFNGPTQNRKCTNLAFLISFIIGNCILIGLTCYILLNGDPSRLSKGYDLRAHVCGVENLESKPFMYFPNKTTTDWSLCIEACPYYYYSNYYCIYDNKNTSKYYVEWGCWDAYETTAYGFYCIPTEKSARKDIFKFLGKPMQVLKTASGDLILSWDIIMVGTLVSLFFGFCYLFLFQKASIIKWVVIFSIGLALLLLGFFVYLLNKAADRSIELLCDDYGPASPEYCNRNIQKFYFGSSIVLAVIGSWYLYRIAVKYKDFHIGIQMIELTCKPLHVIKELLIFPFIQIFIGQGFVVLLALLMLWTMSASKVQKVKSTNIPGGVAYKIEYTAFEQYILVYNVLMSFWWINFLVDLGSFVLAGGVSTWYFSRQKSNLYSPLFKSFKTCIRYHIGSIALGSLLIPLCWVPSLILSPVAKLSQRLKISSPWYQKFIVKSCICYKLYLTKLRYIEKKNYIFLSIFGEDFIQSGVRALHLMRRNQIRIARPGKIGEFIIMILQIIIVLVGPIVTLSLLLFRNRTFTGQLTIEIVVIISPVIFTFINSWFIGRVFAGALKTSMNTVLMSAACDEEMFTREQRFIEADLLDFMDGIGEEQNEQHRENKLKVRVEFMGNSNENTDDYGIRTRNSFGKTKVVPFNESWGEDRRGNLNNSTVSRGLGVSGYCGTPENHSRTYLDDIKEVSLEDDHQIIVGIPAQYVDDKDE